MQSPRPKTLSSLSRSQGTGSTNCSSYGTLEDDDSCGRTSRDGDFLIDGALEHGTTYDLSPSMNIQPCECLNSWKLTIDTEFIAGFEIWPLLLLTGLLIGLMGYVVAVIDPFLFDLKGGYCKSMCTMCAS